MLIPRCRDRAHSLVRLIDCECFGDSIDATRGESFLRADADVRCGTCTPGDASARPEPADMYADHAAIKAWAIVAIVVYVGLVPLGYVLLLRRVKEELLQRSRAESEARASGRRLELPPPSSVLLALDILWEDYRPLFCWWEVPILLKKLLLVGGLSVLVDQGLQATGSEPCEYEWTPAVQYQGPFPPLGPFFYGFDRNPFALLAARGAGTTSG